MMNKAFSLVELSIVIIIIGLLISGVTVANSMIEQAKYRKIISEIGEIERSVKIFKAAYDALPGDFDKAYNYWGDECGGNSYSEAGCNGNNDGLISTPTPSERYRFWQHLKLAGIIDGVFTGVVHSGSRYNSLDNSFPSAATRAYYYVWSGVQTGYWVVNNYNVHPYHNLHLNNATESTWGWLEASDAPFTVEETRLLDMKFDDGAPLTGNMFSSRGWTGGNWTPNCVDFTTGSYDYSNTIGCYIVISGKLIFD
jgi:prepilin-type N-terminal cleavage/methylation domain-containing protein